MGASISTLPSSAPSVVSQLCDEYNRLIDQQILISNRSHRRNKSINQSNRSSINQSSRLSIHQPVNQPNNQYLTLDQLIQFQLPSHLPISFRSLATLYALSQCTDPTINQSVNPPSTQPVVCAAITQSMILNFVRLIDHKCSSWLKKDRAFKLDGWFALNLWHTGTKYGEVMIVQWMINLVVFNGGCIVRKTFRPNNLSSNPSNNQLNHHRESLRSNRSMNMTQSMHQSPNMSHSSIHQSPHFPHQSPSQSRQSIIQSIQQTNEKTTYIHRDSLRSAYELFQPHLPVECSMATWFEHMQELAETHNMMDIDDESLDDYIPLQAFAIFVSFFLTGFFELFDALGLQIEE